MVKACEDEDDEIMIIKDTKYVSEWLLGHNELLEYGYIIDEKVEEIKNLA